MSARNTKNIILNSDLGEDFGIHSFGNDESLMSSIDVANVACGFHAGDPYAMDVTVALAKEHGVGIGAHPGLPDLTGFGRREMKLTPDEVESIIRYQVGALTGYLQKYDVPLNHIKPHGALYGMISRSDELMEGAIRVVKDYGVPIYGLSGTAHQRVAEREGVEFVGEIYVDLNYDANGNLIILRRPHQTDPKAAAARIERVLQDGIIVAEDGSEHVFEFSSICIHSDAPGAADVAAAVKAVLNAQ